MRHYPPPCTTAALPEIDVVLISHSHYDHLDYDTIVELWRANADHLRFVVPLGNRDWFLGMNLGIGEDRVTELDWWTKPGSTKAPNRVQWKDGDAAGGRYGLDSSRSLWSSWTLEHICQGQTFRIFFGGDTGFQFHSPRISARCWLSDLSSVCRGGKTHWHARSQLLPFRWVRRSALSSHTNPIGIIPQLDDGVTGANHMTPRDAVRVSKIMAGLDEGRLGETEPRSRRSHPPVAVAIHWGTFVNDSEEVHQSMRDLRNACHSQGVDYVRSIDEGAPAQKQGDSHSSGQEHSPSPFALAQAPSSRAGVTFACLDHGQSIYCQEAAPAMMQVVGTGSRGQTTDSAEGLVKPSWSGYSSRRPSHAPVAASRCWPRSSTRLAALARV
ncbi:hypothetical protein L7F22_009827 [Adiantum nelumboides]|nr:hypothetical protein [Adiantum nelumboides]